jgi:hypothetical protein
MLSCLPGALSASFWPFLTLKASHVRKNEWLYEENLYVIRVDILYRLVPQFSIDWYLNSLSIGTSILYRLVPQLTPLDIFFLRCGALT